ncbi:MAG: hypothetical protein KA383_13055 [Phycisphaerae bacterium]|nr:hypothetical protein [Phycisphaerae bacterium]
MAEARAKDEWARSSALMALLANCHRDPKKTRALRPSDFDPFAKRPAPIPIDMDSLKAVFLEGFSPRTAALGKEESSCGSVA